VTPDSPRTIFTVGHSTRPLEEFIRILQAYGITRLVDIRTVPRSRHNPQYNRESLPAALEAAEIRYSHLPELGGLRKPRADSPNTGWRNGSFRGFADYMQTPGFEDGLRKLTEVAEAETTAIFCAEAVPWRCHRSLVADALVARGYVVADILDLEHSRPHRLTPFIRIVGTGITYPESHDSEKL
jgi:uncharacterized protein (DUF488 family)